MPTYRPQVFEVQNLDQAKQIILTPQGSTTEERWQVETPVLAQQLARELAIAAGDFVLDYGCGVGRLAKAVIERCDCAVLGADISLSMIQLAPRYVCSHRFAVGHPELLDTLVARGLRFDSAYSVWVIQHCADPETDLRRIRDSLKPGGVFHIVNTRLRCVPTDQGWVNDGIDVIALLRSLFREVEVADVPASLAPADLRDKIFCATCTT